MPPPTDLDVIAKLCADPLITADEAAGRVGPTFLDRPEDRDEPVHLDTHGTLRHIPAPNESHWRVTS